MEPKKEQWPTKVVGGPARFSYANVFQAKVNNLNGKAEYSVVMLISKKNKELLAKIKKGIEAANESGISKVWGGKRPLNLRMPVRDGDTPKESGEPRGAEFKGMWFITAKSNSRPHVVDADRNVIIDADDFYSGCEGNFVVNFYPYSQKGNNGVSTELWSLQKTKDNEKLSGRSSADEDFKKLSDNSNIDEEMFSAPKRGQIAEIDEDDLPF